MNDKFHGFKPKRKSDFAVLEQSTSFEMTNGELVENCIKAGYSKVIKNGDRLALSKPQESGFCYEFQDKASLEYAEYLIKNNIVQFDERFSTFEDAGDVGTATKKMERIEQAESLASIFAPANPFL